MKGSRPQDSKEDRFSLSIDAMAKARHACFRVSENVRKATPFLVDGGGLLPLLLPCAAAPDPLSAPSYTTTQRRRPPAGPAGAQHMRASWFPPVQSIQYTMHTALLLNCEIENLLPPPFSPGSAAGDATVLRTRPNAFIAHSTRLIRSCSFWRIDIPGYDLVPEQVIVLLNEDLERMRSFPAVYGSGRWFQGGCITLESGSRSAW